MAKYDAAHLGYGFLSERPNFAEAYATENISLADPPPCDMSQKTSWFHP
jgi:acetyl/propionyl-CoA carboxylase alpha subunit